MGYATYAAIGVIFRDCAESPSFRFHPEDAAGRYSAGAVIRGWRRHVVSKRLDSGQGFLAEVDGERRMLKSQGFDEVIGQFLVVLFRHWVDLSRRLSALTPQNP